MEKNRVIETRSLLLVYGGLTLVCLIWEYFSRGNPIWSWMNWDIPSFISLLLSLAFVVLYLIGAILLPRFFMWARELEKIFRQILSPLSYFQILMLALLSGFVEEWFFRGILLTHFGLMISSIAFGLGHFIPSAKLWLWSIWTFFIGIILGLIFQSSESLLLVVLIHSLTNGVLLVFINKTGHKSPALTNES